ncbi:hypothetical protein WJX84_009660 [Apatococcus fuscideae]|uniref:Origin recognition complex subunit 2 n=1 Tax=Apatococcus fuscideae TaxID=2026836 RepID=A0AAW1SP00_9CHLO
MPDHQNQNDKECSSTFILSRTLLKDAAAARSKAADLPPKHPNEKQALRHRHESRFYHWLLYLHHGFSLLCYGLGSKREILQRFAHTVLKSAGGVLDVNGLIPNLTSKQILLKAACMLKHANPQTLRRSDTYELLSQIRECKGELYIVLHNIDGPGILAASSDVAHHRWVKPICSGVLGLRSAEAQSLLSSLAACKNIRLIASMDHVNAPLLWDRQAAAGFNWLYQDLTTFAPYWAEVAHMPSLFAERKQEQTQQGAAIVLSTLVPAAQKIFRKLAEHQLDENEDEGMQFSQLFRICRENFIVSNDMALRSHLNEFRDHQLLQTEKGADGLDRLKVPMAADALQSLLQVL